MRVLFAGPPFFGLLYPMIPLAHAFRSAGHDVLVGTCGAAAQRTREAGLLAVDCAPGIDPDALYAEMEKRRQGKPPSPGEAGQPPKGKGFSFFSDEMADTMLSVAGHWEPDLVVHTPNGVVGQLVAARLEIPSVLHAVGFGHTGAHVGMMNNALAPAYERHGLDGPAPVAAWLDVTPPSMSRTQEPRRWSMRYVPFNGGAVLPGWLYEPRTRPRVTVTLGTVRPVVDGVSPVKWVIDAARETDAEFVLALGGADPAELGPLPDNVRTVPWTPLGALLAASDAVVHHGGAGTTLTALDSGLPQVVLGEGADRPANAAAVGQRGCGIVPGGPEDFSPALVQRLLTDDGLRANARETAEEMASMPSPAENVGRLTQLALTARRNR
ncbi:UDP:flavonoid glycosyltransferase YjiC (YdhE family) [Streptomyces sp. Amel2xB2]|uniref:nucleotide disphospho-sugar-binding domain-containing protein n=1 Tax=Streptomyces sp. Amel2xB2 TaxID=1305829 RepID=UPI000DB96F1B|nr:nucleotide disphospho-sugar-binding domain-containing protein [Streptomyces sp. Amel2xB2]RAJ58995.1 UDP:flavonoid glycosyltransferase YjiC (YdhE family) [Streptomyces sp. Amel2xB2]